MAYALIKIRHISRYDICFDKDPAYIAIYLRYALSKKLGKYRKVYRDTYLCPVQGPWLFASVDRLPPGVDPKHAFLRERGNYRPIGPGNYHIQCMTTGA